MRLGEVVLVKFPFSDVSTTKKRPALKVVSHQTALQTTLVTVAMITSKTDGIKLAGDLLLEDWQQAGLLHPSLLRLAKIATLDAALIGQSLGHLSNKDLKKTREQFRKLFRDWIK